MTMLHAGQPASAKFISRDPAVAKTRSAYGYVDGNPLNGTDPNGMTPPCRAADGTPMCAGTACDSNPRCPHYHEDFGKEIGGWLLDNRGTLASFAAIGVCLALTPETLGGAAAVCGGAALGAFGFRAQQRISNRGFQCSLGDNLVDLFVGTASFGLLGLPAIIGGEAFGLFLQMRLTVPDIFGAGQNAAGG